MAEDTQKRLIRYLNDSHAMETGALVALEDIKRRAETPELEQLSTSLIGIVKNQIERLASRITQLDGKVNAGKATINSALASGNSLTNAFHDQADKETQEVMKAYGLCHFEVAVYTSLREYSSGIGDSQTATLAQTLINEEEEAARRLLALLPRLARKPAFTAPRPSEKQGTGNGAVSVIVGTALVAGSTALAAWGISQMLAKKDGSDVTALVTTPPSPSYIEIDETIIVADPYDGIVVRDVPASGSVGAYDTTGDAYRAPTLPPATATASGDFS